MHADVGPTGYVAKMKKKHCCDLIDPPHFVNVATPPPHVDPTHREIRKELSRIGTNLPVYMEGTLSRGISPQQRARCF
jgi:hypothetical protein